MASDGAVAPWCTEKLQGPRNGLPRARRPWHDPLDISQPASTGRVIFADGERGRNEGSRKKGGKGPNAAGISKGAIGVLGTPGTR